MVHWSVEQFLRAYVPQCLRAFVPELSLASVAGYNSRMPAFTTFTTRLTLDGQPVGTGKPGPVCRKLQDAYQAYVQQVAGTPW